MVGAGPVGTGGGCGLTPFLLAKSLVDAVQSDEGIIKNGNGLRPYWLKSDIEIKTAFMVAER